LAEKTKIIEGNKMSNWSWKNEDELMSELQDIQNSDKYWDRDITTIVGMFSSREQLERHISRYKQKLLEA
jgi:hypothetical protein